MVKDALGRPGVSRDAVHVILWERSVRGGKVTVSTSDLATRLGMNPKKTSELLTEMIDAGRLKVVTRRKGASAVYVVVDPAVWFAEHGFEEE